MSEVEGDPRPFAKIDVVDRDPIRSGYRQVVTSLGTR